MPNGCGFLSCVGATYTDMKDHATEGMGMDPLRVLQVTHS